jgi:membrane dipeptidase
MIAGLVAPLARAIPSLAGDRTAVPLGDMHSHLFFVGPRPADTQPLGRNMRAGGAALVAWALVADQPWLTIAPGGFKQDGTPSATVAVKWLHEELTRITAHVKEQDLKIVREGADIDRALAGDPHVVLSAEGASFADEDVAEIKTAYDLGIRQIQLVHYVRNPIADFQTEPPHHKGLSDYGKTVLAECNRLGILVDLAHCTDACVRDALEIAKAPVVWSHSSVTREGTPNWKLPVWQARQLRFETAKAIADKGGVIGLWALGSDVGKTPQSYAKRIAEMADWLGEDHVAFGTDMNALAKPAIASYSDLRKAVQDLEQLQPASGHVRKIAIGNYARVLAAAFAARTA